MNGDQNNDSALGSGAAYVFTGFCSATSGPPVIAVEPQDREFVIGSTATLTVDACGEGPLSYQWHKADVALADGGRVSGAATATLQITNSQLSDAGGYHVVITNSLGSVASQAATLRMLDFDTTNLVWTTGGVAPWTVQSAITHDGVDAFQSGTIPPLGASLLWTAVTGPGTVAFWWKVSSEMDYDLLGFSIDGVVQRRISGEEDWQQAALAVPVGTHTLLWAYGKDDSTRLGLDRAWLDEVVFLPNFGHPVFLVQPPNQRVGSDDTTTLTAGVGGATPRTHQWFFNDNPISGATNASLTLSNIGSVHAGSYHLVVSNSLGFASSSNAVLSVTSNGPIQSILLFTERPFDSPYQSALINLGRAYQSFTDPAAFNTAVASANPANTLVVVDVVVSSKSLNPIGPFANAGGRTLLQYFGLNSLSPLAEAFHASVQEQLFTPLSIYNWGGSQFFTGLSSPLTMSDYFDINGQRLQPTVGGEAVAGYTGMLIANQAAIVIGHSGRTILNGFIVEEMNDVNARVRLAQNEIEFLVALPPRIDIQPQDRAAAVGQSVTFSVTASNAQPLRYQWFFNQTNAITRETNATLTVTNVQAADYGSYSVLVRNYYGMVASRVAALVPGQNVTIAQPVLAQSVVVGGTATFSVAVTGHPPPFGYEWRRISPATSLASNVSNERIAFFTLTNVQTNQAGNYRVIVRNLASPNGVPSTQATLTVLADSDGDGLPEVWETAYPACADPALDCDNDGLTNLEEYRAGTDPTNGASMLRIDSVTAGNSATLEFQALSNRTYTVQHTDHLGGGSWSKLIDVVARATNRTETATDAGAGTNRYYRVVTPRQP